MKTIIYANNQFQSLLCLQAVLEYIQGDRPATQEAFDGKIRIVRNEKSVTAIYLHSKDTIINFAVPVKEEDKNQLKLKL